MKIFFFSIFLISVSFLVIAQSVPKNLGEQLALDNPKLIQYLQSLPDSLKNKKIKGLLLSDGEWTLVGAVYKESFINTQTGLHAYVFKMDKRKEVYAWIPSGGTPVPLPECPAGSQFEGARVLSGDIYTWKALQPGDDVVIILCPNEGWLKSVR